MKVRMLATVFVLAAGTAPIQAHDFWLEPSTFRPEAGAILATRVFVGQGFRGETVPRNESHIVKFSLSAQAEERPMIGRDGSDPAGLVKVPASGLAMIGYESHPTVIELGAEKVQEYIANEGLEPFFRGDTSKPIVDHFSRCAKSLIQVGEVGSLTAGYDRRLGCALELVLEANPSLREERTGMTGSQEFVHEARVGALVRRILPEFAQFIAAWLDRFDTIPLQPPTADARTPDVRRGIVRARKMEEAAK